MPVPRHRRPRAKPLPVLAKVWQSRAERKLEIKLAGIGQRWREMGRAMGIENIAGAHSPFGIMKLQVRRELRAVFV